MSKEKELVWLPNSLAKKIKKLEENEPILTTDLINEYFKDCKDELKANINSLDDDLVVFKGLMMAARKSFEEAKNTQINEMYDLWEKFDVQRSEIEKKISTITEELKPLKEKISELNESISKIDAHKIERLYKTIKEFNNLWDKDRKVLKYLLNNYVEEK
jgi:chromosome segregation ATPase